jgi:glutathione synthase
VAHPFSAAAPPLAGAHEQYVRLHQPLGAVPAMVVQPGERNAYDQQWIQQQLWQAHGVDMVRLTLRQVAEQGSLDAQGQLVVGGRVISVAYFR